MRAIFRVDGGGGGLGMGHLMRCLALAEEFKQQQIDPFFISQKYPAAITALEAAKVSAFYLPMEISIQEDLRLTLPLVQNAQWIIVDSYQISSDYLEKLKQPDRLVIYIDDLIDRFLPVDVVLGNAYATPADYSPWTKQKTTTLFTGPAYIPMSKAFTKQRVKSISPKIDRILLTLGGEDPKNYTESILKQLNLFYRKLHIDILLGPAYRHEASLKETSLNSPHHVDLLKAPQNLPDLFRQADLTIAPPSTIFWQLAATGTPTLAIQTAENQELTTRYIVAHKLGELMRSPEDVGIKLAILEDFSLRKQYSETMQHLVDGAGASRAVNEWIHLYFERQPLHFEPASLDSQSIESQLMWEWRNDPITREMSRNTEEVFWEEHEQWYKNTVADPKKKLFMVKVGVKPCAVIRFDLESKSEAEISINLAPHYRGKGLGKRILAQACRDGFSQLNLKQINAAVKKSNSVSIQLFQSVGFILEKESADYLTFKLKRT